MASPTADINLTKVFVLPAPTAADWLVVAPLVVAFIFAALTLMMRKDEGRQTAIGMTGLALMLVADIALFMDVFSNGTATMAMGRWLPPYGIAFTVDMLGATFALVTGIVGLATGLYALKEVSNTERRYGFFPFLLMMLGGVTTAFVTGDIFNLYVWFEVLLIGSFGLLILGSTRGQIDATTKYAFLNFLATAFFLIAIAYMYGLFGTLNMADIARKSATVDQGPRVTIAALFFFAFASKAAAFPVNFWLPASYHTPRVAVSAVFAGLLTKVGVYALLRVFLTLFPDDRLDLAVVIGVIAALTMVLGALGALAQNDMRRLLGYLIISGIGLLLAGLSLGSLTGLSGTAFYAAHSMIVMTALYMLVGIMGERGGTFALSQAGGLYMRFPGLAVVAFILALAVSGLPPLSGLWPKILLVKASIDVGIWWLAAAILVSGFVTTIAIMRLFALAFWRPMPDGVEAPPMPRGEDLADPRVVALVALTMISIIAGVWPEPFIAVSDRIAFELSSPAGYIDAVFGPEGLAPDGLSPAAAQDAAPAPTTQGSTP